MSAPSQAPNSIHHEIRVISDPAEFTDAVSGTELKVEFQRRQLRPSRVEQFQTSQWALDFGNANVKTCVRGTLPGGWASMCLVLGPGDSTWNGYTANQGSLCWTPPGEEIDGRTAPGFSWLTVALPPELWNRCRTIAGLEDNECRRLAAGDLPELQFAELLRRIHSTRSQLQCSLTAFAAAFSSREAADLATHLAVTACELASQQPPPRESLRNRTRLARRAETWMRDHSADCIRVSDLCLALHVSRRELEYAFRTTYDQSPRDYLHTLRLHAIRRAMLSAGENRSILEIALDHGISHPGRFAADYRSLFGERPSETQRNR